MADGHLRVARALAALIVTIGTVATLWPAVVGAAPGPSGAPAGRCASGPCPLNIGGMFVWHDTDSTVSGRFAGSLVLLPRMEQVSCSAGADVDTSRPQTSVPGGPPHPGLIIPYPLTTPGPGHPLTAFIDLTSYHGPGTYTNSSLGHQTYAYPAGVATGVQTSPVESPGAAWSVTMAADGSGSLTYSGSAENTGPLGPKVQINFTMSWQCDDTATPVGSAAPAPVHHSPSTTSTSSAGLPLPPRPGSNGHLNGVSVLITAAGAALLLTVAVLGTLWWRRRRRRGPACSCSGHVVITGPANLKVCECSHLRWRLIVVTRSVVHLVASAPDGRDAFARQYEAQLVTECEGAVELQPTIYDWTLQTTATSVVLSVVATQVGTCADGSTSVVTEQCTYPVALRPRPCQVAVVIADHHGYLQVNHAAMRITCGEYDSVFDYGPSEDIRLWNILGCPGLVDCHTSSTPDQTLGQDLHGFEPGVDLRLYDLPNVTCTMCEALRVYWLGIMAAPGTYMVATNNCVTHVADALRAAGYPSLSGDGMDPKSPTALERMLGELGIVPQALGVPR